MTARKVWPGYCHLALRKAARRLGTSDGESRPVQGNFDALVPFTRRVNLLKWSMALARDMIKRHRTKATCDGRGLWQGAEGRRIVKRPGDPGGRAAARFAPIAL
jgi:hypothetical protein